MGGPLAFVTSAVADAGGNAVLKVQFGSNAPPQAWAKLNISLDVNGSPSAQLIADTVVLDQAGGPQPQLGPAVFMANQNVSIVVAGAQPLSTIVGHCSGAWDNDLANLSSIATLSGGTIGAQQIVGTPFLENLIVSVPASGSYTSSVFPMLGYTGVLLQFIAANVSTEPTVTLQWLDTSVPPVQLYQSNWQSIKEIDWVHAWGQQLRVQVANNDTNSTLQLTLMLVPLAVPPGRKADILTYKTTATNELLGLHNTPVANGGGTISASTPAGLGYAGPAAIWLDWGIAFAQSGAANFGMALTYGPTGTSRTLVTFPAWCPNIAGLQVDLPNQPMVVTLTNQSDQATVTPSFGLLAAYR